ncbi:hypothetical protein ENUP19_0173G0011 [Entamoeba nuttalli]|uniref:mRNA decapping protein, putative n=2 Tax=Entamoeba nuttalli TaxID=412467 RepID=K2H977_ENTNP|nr:mRNA decapping protein, putative [Entamoeba nuttalli P19]EKE39124.1 mRNA decapping protein, putative [Entamoeba nuttalli P19]|eukprot:XP_008858542.1 mRNA decapping protein, putative [Entamoeba nuttalli P19]
MDTHVPIFTLSDVMNDLCARFVINNPVNEYNDSIRFLFLLELAHWYYMDNWTKKLNYLPMITDFKFFVETFVREVKWKTFDLKNVDVEVDKWKTYKSRISVVGALLLNESLTHVIRVRAPSSLHFSFPRGKMNLLEDPRFSCVRETKEETGITISIEQCKQEYSFVIESHKGVANHSTTYYVIPDIPMNSEFKPMCKEEIAEVKWELIDKIDAKETEKTRLKEIIEKIKKSR